MCIFLSFENGGRFWRIVILWLFLLLFKWGNVLSGVIGWFGEVERDVGECEEGGWWKKENCWEEGY